MRRTTFNVMGYDINKKEWEELVIRYTYDAEFRLQTTLIGDTPVIITYHRVKDPEWWPDYYIRTEDNKRVWHLDKDDYKILVDAWNKIKTKENRKFITNPYYNVIEEFS